MLWDELIVKLAAEQQVVVLIDEYDKPILDNIDNLPEAILIRDTLKQFHTVLKALDQDIRFVFITGISKFSKVGVFSGLNNLTDIGMNPRFATALGITESELRRDLGDHIPAFARKERLTEAALQQINETEYAQKYRLRDKPLTLIGATFDSNRRKVSDWQKQAAGGVKKTMQLQGAWRSCAAPGDRPGLHHHRPRRCPGAQRRHARQGRNIEWQQLP